MKTRPPSLSRQSLLAAAALAVCASAALADDILWNGATTGALNWNTDANWVGGVYPNADTNRADLRKDWSTAPVIGLSAPVTVNGVVSDDTGATGDVTLVISNGGTVGNTLTLGGADPSVLVTGGSTLTVGANLQNTGGFSKTGNGFLLLSGSNSISGNLVISEGTLTTANARAVDAGTTIRVDSGASLRVNTAVTVAGLNDNAGSGGSVGNASGGGKVLTIGGSGTYSFNGNFNPTTANKVGLVVSGAASQTLGGNNLTNTGYQSVTGSGGTLIFAKQDSIFRGLAAGAVANANNPANAGISVSSGATVALGVGDSTSGYFDGAAISTFLDGSHMGASSDSAGFRSGSILGFDTRNGAGGSFAYTNGLANIGTSTGIGFAKLGAGTLVLGGTNTYTGTTTVRDGTLVVNGTTDGASAVTVVAGATLGGTGTIGGETAISGFHSPGNSPGIQTFGSGLTYNIGSTFVWELTANADTGRGSVFDGVDVTGGALTINTGVATELVFNSSGSSVNWSDAFWDGNQQWLVFDNASVPSLGSANIFDTITIGLDSASQSLTSVRASSSFSWAQVGNDVYLNYTVPEPSTYALLALATAGAGAARFLRRRRPERR